MSVYVASGKLVLMGEYAVVDGGTALVLAVEHGVQCFVEASERRVIETPTADNRFVRAALDAIGAPAARYVFMNRAPLETPGKPGMGGSAAATVAALRAGGFQGDPAALTELGIRIHRAVQGSGSGVDIAAAAYGGGLAFRDGRATPTTLPVPIAVYTGKSARTGPRVERYLAWDGRRDFVTASDALVARFADDPITAMREAWRLLVAMTDAAGIAYRTPEIDTLVRLAEQAGGAAKPSGAGGGDSVVALVPDPAPFRQELRERGFAVLDIRPDPPHP